MAGSTGSKEIPRDNGGRPAWRNWGDHPIVAAVTVLASVVGIISFFRSGKDGTSRIKADSPPSAVEAPASPTTKCADVSGRWDWLTTGGVVAIAETGTMKWYRVASDPFPTINGTWECDSRRPRHLTLRWIETGLVDTILLSNDGKRFNGANLKTGFLLSGTRAR